MDLFKMQDEIDNFLKENFESMNEEDVERLMYLQYIIRCVNIDLKLKI